MNVLNAGVREIDLAAPQHAPAHADALFIEAVMERVILEIQRDHGQQEPGPQQAQGQSAQTVEPQALGVRPGDFPDRIQLWNHQRAPSSSPRDAATAAAPAVPILTQTWARGARRLDAGRVCFAATPFVDAFSERPFFSRPPFALAPAL